jgi:hypothetical protein
MLGHLLAVSFVKAHILMALWLMAYLLLELHVFMGWVPST